MLFFFQAEDGIRDRDVTGVQTCALPIYTRPLPALPSLGFSPSFFNGTSILGFGQVHELPRKVNQAYDEQFVIGIRSEERRVGKECRYRWAWSPEKKKRQDR